MYKKIKENIINPTRILNRKDDNFWVSLLYFATLVLVMSLPSVIQSLSFNSLDANTKTAMRVELEDQFDFNCTIDYGLTCDTNEVNIVNLATIDVVFDPESSYTPEDAGVKVVLRENNVNIYSAKQSILTIDYGSSSNPTEWPAEWTQIEIDVENDLFWNKLFAGIDRALEENRNIWMPVIVISSIFAFFLVLLTEIVIDTLILTVFRIGKIKFTQTFKVVLNSMTLYVIIRVILELYNIRISGLMQSLLQMIPLMYALIAIRNPFKR